MFHMREVKIGESICVLVLLFSGLVTCSGVFGSPLTDDVATLETLSENIPSDYRIPIRFITKDVEVTMQTFECHYRRGKWPTRRYFNHVKEVLTEAGSTLVKFHDCIPPPCKTPPAPPFTPGQSRQQNGMSGAIHGLLALLIIPSMALLVLTVRTVFKRSDCCVQRMHEVSLNEPHGGAEESRTGPHSGAAQGDPDSSSSSQQDRAWVDSLGCADTEV
ncbi:kit ligand b isoform X2 [Onychostoma macrolepis]|uniref:kit ligand b isoform X2 n=1 Tax=Onychostoma macrolepis TaxID=369639 RepID=UPI0027296CBE|nr:kit ligand b isoform X2 [Onychostoma macrolepis]